MDDAVFRQRAETILWHMALERNGFWRQLFRRWHINDEPLRNDAANLLRDAGVFRMTPTYCQLVGDDRKENR